MNKIKLKFYRLVDLFGLFLSKTFSSWYEFVGYKENGGNKESAAKRVYKIW